ncbi:retron Ec67 family RNA-directed DNA polymerase/endonuclease [Ralstonia pseudosolanacearum]|nr:retron Ec67 family RNA-directed DNA polymerase/endonuclease [Ralstonia pseudosolanacearum]QKL91263.1 RNA-directed DNA polymerase [Ralstonia solanacearum]QKL96339.1 RNA-directed DNA polymerase [Ralstonia solanacearum]QLR09455.1 RNA-directed DNA polymerase [Ralstonia solanacearum]UNJ30393.1 retron Ec67 family RNA-directed DNA polymerase/endonuclease [Ralstonia pseudosolanacearum]USS49207.1 retron Ec67 family RNA-directed DNA polymerase/endonuclease [Ralstonia solanacearum]
MLLPKNKLQWFQAAKSRAELAILLDIKHKDLTYLLYVKKDPEKYKIFSIPKKSGGSRDIHAPIPELKSLQRKLATALEECIADVEELTNEKNKASHGFCPGKSILTNASVHRNKRYVFNIDLEDFFPSITGQRVRGFFIKDKNFAFDPSVATAIAHIACRDGKLPQGSPCSPVISNLIAGILDVHLSKLAKVHGCIYTRYADDITFSTNKENFPATIAYRDEANEHCWKVGEELRRLILKCRFSINEKKTRMQYRSSRQQVTGLVVNKRVNVTSEYRYLVRAYVAALVKNGKYTIKRQIVDATGKQETISTDGTPAQLHGMLGFIHSVDSVFRTDVRKHPYNYPGQQANDKKPTGNLAIYRRFLIYTRFYANALPLIVCEGKTDGVYISNAVHQTKSIFPSLVKKDKDGKDVLSFQLLKYARKHKKKDAVYLPNYSTITILGGGSGGGANLGNLIRAYHGELGKFKAPRGKQPVIFIVDNDSGGKKVFSVIKEVLKKNLTGEEPFVRLFSNLYIVPIPLGGNKERSIEQLFSDVDIAKGLNGKSFDFSADSSSTTSVGKVDFAYEFVAKQAKNIDWKGFHPLLQNIVAAIDDYAAHVVAEGL